jgi:hypothetical protein
MNPFLEDPAVFPDLHDSLIIYLRESLNAQLPAPYFASSASRVWVELTYRRVGPDVIVPGPEGIGLREARQPTEAVAAEPIVIHVAREEVREVYLQIYARPGGEQLVTTVEVLSITNKTPGEQGRDAYLRKQRELLESEVNLVEIDLLRGGQHTTSVPRDAAFAQAGPFDYHICVRAFEHKDDYLVYPILLTQTLPRISVPLLRGDPVVQIDLQALLDRCYDTGQYARQVRYRDRVPAPRLRREQAEWVAGVLRAKGIV